MFKIKKENVFNNSNLPFACGCLGEIYNLRILEHCVNGSPVYPVGQAHTKMKCHKRKLWNHLKHSHFWWTKVFFFFVRKMHLLGWWLLVWQTEPIPQVFGHGSAHRLLIHARSDGHSLDTRHSGRHCGGVPMKFGWHEQTAWPALSLQLLFGPHGLGEHGWSFCRSGGVVGTSRHWKNGSPVNPGGHVHVGICFETLHIAKLPQIPTHGSIHLYLTHANRSLQSSFTSHSRLQPRCMSYGFPSKPGWQ